MYKFLGIALIVIGCTEGLISLLIKKEKILNEVLKDKSSEVKGIFIEMCNLEGLIDVAIGSLGIIFSSLTFIIISWLASILFFYLIYIKRNFN